jgi:hypothetical protein
VLKTLSIIAASTMLLSAPLAAADYKCADANTSKKLNDYDITISNRQAGVAEMLDEVKQGGGSTEQQKKALATLEEKLATAKTDREALLKGCNAQ